MATTRICYKNAQGQIVCYDAGSSMLQARSADTTSAKQADTAAAAGPRPGKGAAVAQMIQALNDALAASGNRQLEGQPEYISLEYYAD